LNLNLQILIVISTMPTINIKDIDRVKLLEELWKRAPDAAFFGSDPGPSFSVDVAKKELRQDGYADYICGRPIKTNIFTKDEIDPYLYDRDSGYGAFKSVVDSFH
jgi:hypothetical protein